MGPVPKYMGNIYFSFYILFFNKGKSVISVKGKTEIFYVISI